MRNEQKKSSAEALLSLDMQQAQGASAIFSPGCKRHRMNVNLHSLTVSTGQLAELISP
jgi:hypothetical protein